MKKILKISLMLGIVLLAMNVYAVAINFSFHKKFRQEKMVTFGLNDNNKIALSIYDADDKLIHTESVYVNGKMCWTYDLNNFPEGLYYLVAESKSKITKYEVLVVGEKATIMSDPLSVVSKPVL
jgi:hypothetical protein